MKAKTKLKCIYIYYRHVGRKKQQSKDMLRPEWFTFEGSFRSLINSIESSDTNVRIDLTIIFDGDNESFNEDFISNYVTENEKTPRSFNFNLKMIKGGSALGASRAALDYVKSRKIYDDNELIYILENDYIHAPNWINEVVNLFNSEIDFDYISLYDHSDKYSGHPHFRKSYKNLKSKIFVTSSWHWRTTPSSCGSFLVLPNVFFHDYILWNKSRLTDRRIYPLLKWVRGRILLTPIPGLSTHCMNGYLSPCVDWQKYILYT